MRPAVWMAVLAAAWGCGSPDEGSADGGSAEPGGDAADAALADARAEPADAGSACQPVKPPTACNGVCGDAVADPCESCDLGADNSDTLPGGCRTNCEAARCRDGVLDPGELCLPGGFEFVRQPTIFAIADLDGDANPDLAVTQDLPVGQLAIFRGTGRGDFVAGDTTYVGEWAASLALGDVDGDGDIDAAVAGNRWHDVRLLVNDGAARFTEELRIEVGEGLRNVAIGDVNADGDADLVINTYGLQVWLNQGGGTFERAVLSESISGAHMLLADLDGDATLDVALANWIMNRVEIHHGNRDGTFAAAEFYSVGDEPTRLAAGDFNEDCRIDLAVNDAWSSEVSILLATSTGAFEPDARITVGVQPRSIATADFDGDGHLDLAVTEGGATTVSDDINLLLGDGLGGFRAGPQVPGAMTPMHVIAADVDTDGDVDLLTLNAWSEGISVAVAEPEASFAIPATLFPDERSQYGAMGDLNGDGTLDLVSADVTSEQVRGALGDGAGSFQHVSDRTAGAMTSLMLADFDDDGVLDVVVAIPDEDAVAVLLGRGDGSFRVPVTSAAYRANEIVAGDFDNDDILDLVVANGQPAVRLLLGAADGTFTDAGTFPAATFAGDLTTGYLDGDANLDLVVADYLEDRLYVLLGTGDGGFAPRRPYATASTAESVAVWDATGDEVPDLLTVTSEGLVRYRGRGDGTFGRPVVIASDIHGGIATIHDMNQDGLSDVITAGLGPVDYSVVLGLGNGSFAAAQHFAMPNGVDLLFAGDVNSDGLEDVVTGGLGWNIALAAP